MYAINIFCENEVKKTANYFSTTSDYARGTNAQNISDYVRVSFNSGENCGPHILLKGSVSCFFAIKGNFKSPPTKANYFRNWKSFLGFIHIDIMVGWLWLASWFGDDRMVGF